METLLLLTISSSSAPTTTRIKIPNPVIIPPHKTSRGRSSLKHSTYHFPVVSSVQLKPSKNSTTTATSCSLNMKMNITSCSNENTTLYKDNFFDLIAINYLSQTLQHTTGMRNEEKGYESFVAASRAVFRRFDPIQQRETVVKVLLNAFPEPLIFLVRKLFPPSKFSRQICAAFTSVFFRWLVGPCEVRTSEVEGVREKNVVYIKKCRFLETSNCAGMCTNLCKIPTQEFMKNTLGIPINMVPNFDDMSCEYIFGEHPPALQDDPALKQPCYKLCNMKHRHTSCINGDPQEHVVTL